MDPGPVRAIYNDDNREKFDVVYHQDWSGDFTRAVYRPRTDVKAAVREGSRGNSWTGAV
jgi:hypothetical protein